MEKPPPAAPAVTAGTFTNTGLASMKCVATNPPALELNRTNDGHAKSTTQIMFFGEASNL